MKNTNEIVQLLTHLRNKGGAWQSTERAYQSLLKLEKLLEPKEYQYLSTAYSHYAFVGEGAEELRDECNKLIKKYSF